MTMTAVADRVDASDPNDIVDAMLHRRMLEFPGDDTPWELYAALREQAPVFDSAHGMWILTRFEDALKALLHRPMDLGPRLRKEAAEGNVLARTFAPTMLYFEDPEDTLRQRRLVRQAFTRQSVQKLRGDVEVIVDEYLDRCAEMGRFDLFHDFADHIPVRVICETLGVPREDVHIFRDFTRLMAPATGAVIAEDTAVRVEEATVGLREYISDLIADLREQDNDDLLSKMIRARDEGSQLSEEELIGLAIFILSAGSDTTTQLITGGIYSLTRFPDQMQMLRRDPARMAPSIEELMRHSGPVHYTQPRTLTEPLELASQTIPVGETVLCSVAAANRDPEQFEDPDRLDLERPDVRQLGFSQGIHLCIGAMLARLEGEVAIGRVLQRFEEVEVAQDEVEYLDLGPMRGIAALQVETIKA